MLFVYGVLILSTVSFCHLVFRFFKDPEWLFVRYLYDESAGLTQHMNWLDRINLSFALIFFSGSVGVAIFYVISALLNMFFPDFDGDVLCSIFSTTCAFLSLSIVDLFQRQVAWRYYKLLKCE